jgi:ABC transporter DrrB family efflux protein
MENNPSINAGDLFSRPSRVVALARDTMAIAHRNLIDLVRVPQLLVFTLIQPIIFVIIFRYVFGGAIYSPPGVPYVNYLMPGIFVQTVVFGSITTGVSMATDLKSGLIERFLSLPMTRTAVIAGRTLSDIARMVLVVMLIVIVGFAVGFRVQTNAIAFFAGLLLVLLFAYALLWVFVFVGLAVRDPESAQAASFPVIAPLVFASSALVPVSTMPSWLQGFATYQPVSAVASAVRALCIGGPTLSYVLQALAWCAGVLLVFVPLSMWRYRHSV